MENRELVDQKRSAMRGRIDELFAAEAATLARQGAVVETWRTHEGRRLGPYYRLAYRSGGRQRSLYLGCDCDLAEEVRRRLATLQAPRRQQRMYAQWGRRVAQGFRLHKQVLRAELAQVGLTLKGNEVRGLRALATRCKAFQAEGAER